MDLESIRQECSSAVGAGLEHFLIPIVECLVVVTIQVLLCRFPADHIIEILWRLWHRLPVLLGLLGLLVLPLLLACLQVDLN